jgi:hypothetical protein
MKSRNAGRSWVNRQGYAYSKRIIFIDRELVSLDQPGQQGVYIADLLHEDGCES